MESHTSGVRSIVSMVVVRVKEKHRRSASFQQLYIQKNEVRPLPHTIYKNLLKMYRRPKCIKLLEEYIGISLHDLGLGNGFLDMQPNSQSNKIKNKLVFIRFKNFCASKTTIKKSDRRKYLQIIPLILDFI